eukprot:2705671-Pleurochrysis_carterae.AAC.1
MSSRHSADVAAAPERIPTLDDVALKTRRPRSDNHGFEAQQSKMTQPAPAATVTPPPSLPPSPPHVDARAELLLLCLRARESARASPSHPVALEVQVAERARDGEVALDAPAAREDHVPACRLRRRGEGAIRGWQQLGAMRERKRVRELRTPCQQEEVSMRGQSASIDES